MVKRQQFTAEFKREAVRQMRAGAKPIAQLSRGQRVSGAKGVRVTFRR
jgi:transposase-like protein